MRRSVAACIGLVMLFGVADRARSTSTLAWAKVDLTGSGFAIECADTSGNLYAGFTTTGKFTVSKFDPYGAQVWTNSDFAAPAFGLDLIAVDPTGNVYAVGVELTNSEPHTPKLFKFGPDGSPLWVVQWSTGSQVIPIAIQADTAGVRVAYKIIVSGASPILTAIYYDTNGIQTASVTDTTVTPTAAKFCLDTNLLYTGEINSSLGSGSFRLVEPGGTILVDVSSTAIPSVADSDSNDNVYLANNIAGSSPTFQLAKFDKTGAIQWVTKGASGSIDLLAVAKDNQVFVYNNAANQLQLFDPDIVPFPAMGPPTPVFSEASAATAMAGDPGGGIVTVNYNVFRRYDLHGTLTWAQTFTVANWSFINILDFTVPATGGGQSGPDPVYFMGDGLNSGTSNASMFVGKYVANTAVLQLTLSPTSVTGGSPTVGTVKLNAPAGAGGASVALSSSVPGLANPPATLTIPQGGSSGTFAAPTPPVDVAEAVTLSATYGGVRRSRIVNVIPATLFSVTTPVSMVKGGSFVTGTVALTGRAGPSGRSAAMSSSNTAAASVPPSVNVAPYASSVNFVVATHPVTASATVTITARLGTVTKATTLTVTP